MIFAGLFFITVGCFGLVSCSHFRGASFSWAPTPDGNVTVAFRISWRRSSGGHSCDNTTIANNSLLGGGSALCYSGSASGCPIDLKYYCTDYSEDDDWTTGRNTLSIIPPAENFTLKFSGSAWVVGGGWSFQTYVDLTTRSDNGKINTSPTVEMAPVINLQQGCSHTIALIVGDVDGDIVKCRWANGLDECNSACYGNSFALPNAVLDQDACSITYTANDAVNFYGVAIQVEDFASPTSTAPLSSIPVQFLVKVYDGQDALCANEPEFIPPTPVNGQCFVISVNDKFNVNITVRGTHSFSAIATTSAVGMKHSEDRQWYDGTWYYISMNVTYEPSSNDVGQDHSLCFYARDINGIYNTPRCINVPVDVPPPTVVAIDRVNITNTWILTFDRTFSLPENYVDITVINNATKSPVTTINTENNDNVIFDTGNKRINVTLDYLFNPIMDYFVTVPKGLVRRAGGCDALSPEINETTGWKIEINCDDIDAIDNGSVKTPNGTDHPHSAVFECDKGFVINGNKTRPCLINATWGGQSPSCEVPVCDELEEPVNGIILSTTGRIYGSVTYFKCNDGYLLVGDDTTQCTIDATWSTPAPTCKEKVNIGASCDNSDICRSEGALCINSTCTCKTGIYNDEEDLCDNMKLYPYGEENGDTVVDNTDDVCSKSINFHAGLPIYDDVHKVIYVCLNGLVTAGELFLDPLPQRNLSLLGNRTIMAPFYADTTGGTVNYRTYDIKNKPDELNNKAEVKHVVALVETLASVKLKTTFILFATWYRVRPVQDLFDGSKESTFQLVLVTDGSNTFVFYIYGHGMMQWTLKSKSKLGADIWIGFTSSMKYNFTNILSFTNDVTSIDVYSSTKGISGLLFNRLTHPATRPPSDEVRCYNWYNENVKWKDEVKKIFDVLPECPGDALGAGQNPRYVMEYEADSKGYKCAELLPAKQFGQFGMTCCYDINGNFVSEIPHAGSIQLYRKDFNKTLHFVNDIDTKDICCKSVSTCRLYYDIHPIGKRSLESKFDSGACFGDPHFLTLDGMKYTCNGFGEYVLVSINNTDETTGNIITFDLHARTDRAIKGDGSFSFATRFRAFAAMDHSNASFHIELNDAQDGYTLFVNRADLSIQSGTRSFNYTSPEENIVLTKQQNVIVVLFPHTDISLNVTVGVKMLSLGLAINKTYRSMTKGMLGNFDGVSSNDFITPNGDILSSNMSEEDIYHFGQLWEVDPHRSAFVYPAGKNHSDFHNATHVPKFLADANQTKVQEGYNLCGGQEKVQCVFDYVFTDDEQTAKDTKGREELAKFIKRTNNQTVPKVDVCDMVFINKGEEATCLINIGNNPGVQVNVTKTSQSGHVTYDPSGNIIRFTIDDITPDIISVSIVNADNRSTEVIVPLAICTGCSQHGVCLQDIDDDDERQTEKFKYQICECEPQYEGVDCELVVDGCRANPCSALRKCTKLTAEEQKAQNVSHHCGPCPDGYQNDGEKCKDINECENGENNCQQACLNNAGSYECTCYQGYRISSSNTSQCLDINECDEALHNCSHICSNGDGNYTCSCLRRYSFSEATGECILGDAIDVCADSGLDCNNTSGCTQDENDDVLCFCETGLMLSDNGTECLDIDECKQNVCPQVCTNTHGSFRCNCYPGYKMTDGECLECEFPTWGKNCENECNCSLTTTVSCDRAFGCECLPGWHGDSCDTDIDECRTAQCTDTLQECVNIPGSYRCDCRNGYEFSDEQQQCIDIDECSRPDLHSCSQICTNTIGGYSCACNDGFVLYNGTQCQDIDDCDVGTSTCEQLCDSGKFISGSYNCYCHYGYLLKDDRRTCRKDPSVRNSCEVKNLNCSHFCKPDKNPADSKCQCKKGYKLAVDLQACLDIDECSDESLNKCDDVSECSNTEGSYLCKCPIGTMLANNQRSCQVCDAFHYGIDCKHECSCVHGKCNPVSGCQCDIGWSGQSCNKDIDECASSPCPETADTECINTPGSYLCQCKAGYTKTISGECADIDECLDFKSSKCDQECRNTPGSFECECIPGFRFVDGRCEDLDECRGISKCHHYCNNTIGSYRCTCRDGFKLDISDRQSCKPENECDPENITYCEARNASCVMVEGNTECICIAGYKKETDNSDLCVDVQECSEDTTPCQHDCIERQGGFKCQCDHGFFLLDDGVSCQECRPGYFGLNCGSACGCDEDNTVDCDPVNGKCYCKAGWRGDECDDDVNECNDTDISCVNHSNCVNTIGSYVCECDEGYFKTGSGECEVCDPQWYGKDCSMTCTCDMDHTVECNYVDGECDCLEGWDGENCTENIVECDTDSPCLSKPNSKCVDTPGSFTCQCNDGYLSQNDNCIEIDECFDGTAECDQQCVNSNGSFHCQCYPGFEGYWNDCIECSNNRFGFNCSETCTCNATNAIDPVQTCIPADGTCVCRDEWSGETCNDDVNECTQDEDICNDNVNTKCYNMIDGYECKCLRGFARNGTEDPCEKVVVVNVTLPDGWTSVEFFISLDVSLPADIDLNLESSYNLTETKLITALTTFTKQYTNGTFQIKILDIRSGSIEVDYRVSFDGKSDIGDQLTYAAVDLAAGKEMVYNGEVVSVKSTQFDNGTDACMIYTSILNHCVSPYECVVEEERPLCRLKTFVDNFRLIIGLTVGLGFLVLVTVGFVFCGLKLRQATNQNKLRYKEMIFKQQQSRSVLLEQQKGVWQYDGRDWKQLVIPDLLPPHAQDNPEEARRSKHHHHHHHHHHHQGQQHHNERQTDHRRSKIHDQRSSYNDGPNLSGDESLPEQHRHHRQSYHERQ